MPDPKMLSDRKRVVQLKNVVRHKPSEQDLTRGQIKRSATRNGEEDVGSPIYQKNGYSYLEVCTKVCLEKTCEIY